MFSKFQKWARAFALAFLVSVSVLVVAQVAPQHATNADLVTDIRTGRTSVVEVALAGSGVSAAWSDGPLSHKSEIYTFPYDLPGADPIRSFEQAVNAQLPSGERRVVFRQYDPAYGFGGLSLLAPILLPTVLGWSPWSIGTYLILLLVAGGIVIRSRREPRNMIWLLVGTVTLSGFLAYLWKEPTPLLRVRRIRCDENPAKPVRISGATMHAIVAGLAVVVLGLVIPRVFVN